MIRFLFTLVAALALSACGFHLRDSLALPADLGAVRVVAPDPYSPLAEQLSLSLERAGAVPAAANATDASTLEISTERWGDTPISIDQIGRAQEFSLRYAVVFDLKRASGETLVPAQTIELSRDYIAPPVDGIGTTSERELLAREMRREMVSAILRRIDVVSKAPAPVPSETSSP
jgi:LPS-assembly lipoprotein